MYSLWNNPIIVGFLIVSGGIEVNQYARIHLILEAKFGDNPKEVS